MHSVCISDWSILSACSSPCPGVKDDVSTKTSEKQCFCEGGTQRTSAVSLSRFSRKTDDDTEITVIYNRIAEVFERAISRLEFATIIPKLAGNLELRCILTDEESKLIGRVFPPEIEPTCPQSGSSKNSLISADSYIDESKTTSKSDLSISAVCQAFEVLYNRARFREMAKDVEEDGTSTLPTLFLYHFRSFVDDVLAMMRLTPEQAREKELHYRKMWRDQKQCMADVTTLTAERMAIREEHKKELDVVMTRYKKDLVAVEGITRKSAETMRLITVKCERKQLIAYKASEAKQTELRSVLSNVTADLEALRESNLHAEQIMRNKRFKVQSQLQAIINKFDTEIGDRHRQFLELMETYEADKIEKHNLLNFIRDFENSPLGEKLGEGETYRVLSAYE